MFVPKHTTIPSVVRVKPGALDRLGIYAERQEFARIALFFSKDLDERLIERSTASLHARKVEILLQTPIESPGFEKVTELFHNCPRNADAIIGFGGGKALDVGKYIAFLWRLPYFSVPTSLSNDGFCSSQSSLIIGGRRHSLPAAIPSGVVLDTAVCLNAPAILWHSGVGDLVSKFTAVTDWKMAFHQVGTPVDDFAALVSDASVYQFMARPKRDLEGIRLLGTALLLNGISMSICGSSRPGSGSEHLISHALDSVSKRPRLHGLQVGVASYLVSLLQGQHAGRIAELFDITGFWQAIADDPFDREEWLEACRIAPSIKSDYYTVLSSRDCLPEIERALDSDSYLRPCFG
ncbi:MAG: iron-containing alcohol dehydrogenase family protein [Verrucomicrobia bacterium]|nr:iron-containing alcohol dehydrogenase family protein [Verrucomicrobiota bacterium]MBV8277774.1 iron-containing alcohol dehydrogenase family protein [Verrucomicrobiota bacterium]